MGGRFPIKIITNNVSSVWVLLVTICIVLSAKFLSPRPIVVASSPLSIYLENHCLKLLTQSAVADSYCPVVQQPVEKRGKKTQLVQPPPDVSFEAGESPEGCPIVALDSSAMISLEVDIDPASHTSSVAFHMSAPDVEGEPWLIVSKGPRRILQILVGEEIPTTVKSVDKDSPPRLFHADVAQKETEL